MEYLGNVQYLSRAKLVSLQPGPNYVSLKNYMQHLSNRSVVELLELCKQLVTILEVLHRLNMTTAKFNEQIIYVRQQSGKHGKVSFTLDL